MVFSSMIFLWIFFPVTLIVYYLLSFLRCRTLQNVWLLLASVLFYSYGEPKYIMLLLLSVLINYLSGLAIGNRAERCAGDSGRPEKTCAGGIVRKEAGRRKAALFICVALNLGLLGYFKYYNFAAELFNAAAGHELMPVRNIVLPIGISFYTFQAMSYVIDLYRGKTRVQRSFYKLALYITFFPQLIAGPIVRYRDVAEQIDERSIDLDRFSAGIRRFVLGLSKKVLIANTAAEGADLIFAMEPGALGMPLAWAGIVLYALQIYYDFSGYSDMAIGLGKMFGFEFLENFDLPYVSRSIREFWHRWHISLSTWFKEYLYIPLGGNRKGKKRTYANLMLVFLATGLWHGAGLTFLFWGLWHGVFLLLERAFLGAWLDRNRIKPLNHIYTLLVVLLGWVFFRAETLSAAGGYLQAMFLPGTAAEYTLTELLGKQCIAAALIGLLFAGLLPKRVMKTLSENPYLQLLYVPALLFLCIMMLAGEAYNPFIYFRF